MGNSCCIESRDKVIIYSEPKSNQMPSTSKEEKLVLQSNNQCKSKQTKFIMINSKFPDVCQLNIHKENEAINSIKELPDKNNSSSQMLLNRIKNITSYKPKQTRPLFNLSTNLLNSKLAYSSFTCDKTPSNNPSKIEENKSLKNQEKDIIHLKTTKLSNELINYLTLTCWKMITDYLNNTELIEVRRCCLFLNRLACSPHILKKFFLVQTPKGVSDKAISLKTSKTDFKFDFSNITNLLKRRSNLKEETASKTNYSKSNTYSRKASQSLEIIHSAEDSNATPAENFVLSINERNVDESEPHEIKLQISKINVSQLYDSIKVSCNESSSSNNKSKLLSVNSKLMSSILKNSADKFSGSISDISCGTSQPLSISNRTNIHSECVVNVSSSTNLICMLTPISNMSPTNLSRMEAKSLNDNSLVINNVSEAVNFDKG